MWEYIDKSLATDTFIDNKLIKILVKIVVAKCRSILLIKYITYVYVGERVLSIKDDIGEIIYKTNVDELHVSGNFHIWSK